MLRSRPAFREKSEGEMGGFYDFVSSICAFHHVATDQEAEPCKSAPNLLRQSAVSLGG